MLNEERNEVVEIFKKNIGGYLALNDLQEVITSISYLFWNAKFKMKNNFSKDLSNKEIDNLLQQGTKKEQNFIWNICNSCRGAMTDSNLINIISFLDKLSEEKLKKVICEDYELYSRFSSATPKSINELAYKILEKNSGTEILDICSYTGNFLTNYATKHKEYNYTGIEINYHSSILAEEKLKTQNVSSKIISANVLGYNFRKKYDKIFCNHPFMLKLEQKDYDLINNANNCLCTELSRRITSDWGFVSSVLNAMSDNGKAVVVMHNGGLFKLPDQEIRKELVEKGYIESVIALPGGLFSSTKIETTLLVLSKENKKIKFIDATNLYENDRPNNKLKVDEIFNEYTRKNDSEITKTITFDEIAKMSYSLLVSNYMSKEKVIVKNPKVLSEVVEIFRGYQVSSTEISQLSENTNNSEPYQIINITNVNNGKIDKELTTIYPENDKMDRYLLQDKDLLVSSKGTINKFAVIEIKNNEKYIASGNFNILRLDTNQINPYYLKMFFESSKGSILLDSIRSGGILPALNMTLFKEIEIPVPPMEEQEKAIAKYLAKKDEIEIMQNKLSMLEQNVQDIIDKEF